MIVNNRQITDFMQAADLFDKAKVIGSIREVNISFAGEITLEDAQLILDRVRVFFNDKKLQVTFIHLLSIENEDVILKNVNCRVTPYFNPGHREISDGAKCFMFHHFLKQIGLEHTTDEHMFVKTIGPIK